MAHHSPRHDNSPNGIRSAFHWPIPPSKSGSSNTEDLSIREILHKYEDNPELLAFILKAKSEEDKKQAARDNLKAEEARIQLRQMDLDYLKEQGRYERAPIYHQLAPVQQQVLARITNSDYPSLSTFTQPPPPSGPAPPFSQRLPYPHPPPSPAGFYPHSAHPLCPPEQPSVVYRMSSSSNRPQSYRSPYPGGKSTLPYPSFDTSSPISPTTALNTKPEDKLSHSKVMEALKAKLQRGHSSLGTSPSSRSPQTTSEPPNKRLRKLPFYAPTIHSPSRSRQSSSKNPATPSPRSAKPVLPPIDTTVGRRQVEPGCSLTAQDPPSRPCSYPISTTETPSPSDRRARSLSPSIINRKDKIINNMKS
ncbi:uncharacterized protein BYT42DRAFT_488444 [Radiomyces spectabilis]|uniref:uncharacterized protein n=1 Tax=Radiomyces spectabilis TaxID=64574 RepID=UPI00221F3F82|nr:uncharacterized protein BYT42DRAFT_488444 [Radiomyces spectabilis]KAI8393326.1 hypothetical protein BYT42DRAFT_488444 [Radiomyces spectabilis]